MKRAAIVGILALLTLLAATVASAASSTATFSVGSTTIRLAGTQRLYQIDTASGAVTRSRRVTFSSPRTFAAANDVSSFGDRSFVEVLSGRWSGWWVRARELAPADLTRLDVSSEVTLPAGKHAGLRFYANGRARTRRPVTLDSEATFSASRSATFNGRTYYFLSSGPLAKRWVSASAATLTSARSASSPEQPDTTEPTVAASDPLATWKTLLLVYPATDVHYSLADGGDTHFQAQMSASMRELAVDTATAFASSVRSWSGGYAAIDLHVIEVEHPITSLDEFGGGYWVGPQAIAADLDAYAPSGTYDSVIVVWQAKGSAGDRVPVPGWGLSLQPGPWANGAGFSSVTTPAQDRWWTQAATPEEVFVHEWMHQVVDYEEDLGRASLDLHAGAAYGYSAVDGSWKRWLQDVMQGHVMDGDELLGIGPDIWAAGTPTQP